MSKQEKSQWKGMRALTVMGIDTAAQAVSVAICTPEKVIASGFLNVGLTHSQTMMPLVRDMLEAAKMTLEGIDAFAVSTGPGSFTGLRIGVSAVKGLAQAMNKPCIAVSTLEALAYNLAGYCGIVCAVMDARRSQVYNALFLSDGLRVQRLCEDRAIAVEGLALELQAYTTERILLVGDGAWICHKEIKRAELAPAHLQHQLATSVCAVAFQKEKITPAELSPAYLRKPQAQREREQREKQ